MINMKKHSNEEIRALFKDFLSVHNISEKEFFDAIKKKQSYGIPLEALNHSGLGILESIVKYYKEQGLSYDKISKLLNRKKGSIICSYNNSIKKFSERFSIKESSILIPYSIFRDRKFGVLESLSLYMKDKLGMKYSEIARALNRNDRTIWTVYNRAKKK